MKNILESNWIIVVVLFCGLLLSAFSSRVLYKSEERAIVLEFQQEIDQRAASLEQKLLINFEALESVAILFHNNPEVSFEDFTQVTSRILSHHNNIQALEFIPRVSGLDRLKYEAELQYIFPGFTFTERQSQGSMVKATQRDEYFPVYFVNPIIGNEAAIGFDLISSSIRKLSLEQSRDGAKPVATASIILVQDSEAQKGFLVFRPLYQGITSTLENRRNNLNGFILGVYRITDIFNSSAIKTDDPHINLRLVDVSQPKNTVMLFSQELWNPVSSSEQYHYEVNLPEMYGRSWSIQAQLTDKYLMERRNFLPQVIFTSGMLATLMIGFFILLTTRRTKIIKKIVDQKTIELSAANHQLTLLSRTDGLTGIANKRHLTETLDIEWLRALRNHSTISLIMIDVDFFKQYNDNYGHIQGDECLKSIASCLDSQIRRAGDLLARFGGEEFIIILPDTEDAAQVAEACRTAIENLEIPHAHSIVANTVTISLGVGTFHAKKEHLPSHLLETTDRALLAAKKTGRNRVIEVTK